MTNDFKTVVTIGIVLAVIGGFVYYILLTGTIIFPQEFEQEINAPCSTSLIENGYVYRHQVSGGGHLNYCVDSFYPTSVCRVDSVNPEQCELIGGVIP